jgi:hypothetical protein
MEILLAFGPFIIFVIVNRFVGLMPGLIAAAIVAAVLLARDAVNREKSIKVLDVGTIVLFGGMAAYVYFAEAAWPLFGVRLRVDVGLLTIVLISIAIRRPFTLQYARERVAREFWNQPEFVRTNYVITAAWGGAFVAMIVADLVMLSVPTLNPWLATAVTVAALVAASRFTVAYPERVRAQVKASVLK